MSNNIEEEVYNNRESRILQNGPGPALLQQVKSRDDMEAQSQSEKYYKRQGTGTLGGFNQMQMFKDGVSLQPRDDGSFVVPNEYIAPGTRTIFGVDQANGKKVEDTTAGPAYMAPLRMVAGGIHDAAQGTVDLGLDIAEGMGADVSGARANRATYKEPEWLQQSSGGIEDIGRTMAQFVGGYAAAGKGLAKAGVKQGFKKEMGASIVAGQTFDPAEGSIGTLMNEYGMLPEMARYFDSKMTEKEMGTFHGRMSLVLEEAALGGGIATVGKMMRSAAKAYKNQGDVMIQEGVAMYTKATGSLNHPSLGAQGTEIMSQNRAQDGLARVAGGMQIKNGTVDQFMEYASEGGIDENLAKKAWNQASKSRLERVTEFVTPSPVGPLARQKGNISLFGGEAESSVAKIADFESVAKYFDKQIARGNMQSSEMKDSIKPAMDYLKEIGIGSASPQQIIQIAKAKRPEFKTITKEGEESRFDKYQYHPYEGLDTNAEGARPSLKITNSPVSADDVSIDYKEHLFVARNETIEGPEGYVNSAHFSEPFVKGIARTSLMGNVVGPGKIENKKLFIQEMQSDSASVARKYGEWTDAQIESLSSKKGEEFGDYVHRVAVRLMGDQKGGKLAAKFDRGDFSNTSLEEEVLYKTIKEAWGASDLLSVFRKELASPSAFNNEKAWVRQTVRPVVEDAVKQGADKIVLASSDIINARWEGTAPHDKYQSGYPKILKQYFKGIGVPEKDIHMPTKSSDSFWVKLPKEVMEGAQKLPQYSIAGSAPVSMKFGEEDDK